MKLLIKFHPTFVLCSNGQKMEILQNFVAFSEYMNFKIFTFYGENLAKKVPAHHGTSVSLVIQTISCRIKT